MEQNPQQDYNPPPPETYGMPPGKPEKRPTGVTVLGILYVISGLMVLMSAVMFTAVMGDFGIPDLEMFDNMLMICLSIVVIVALIYILIAVGLFKGARWARVLAIVFAILGLFNIPIGTIISIIILIYLFKPEVKAWFN